MHLPDNWPSLTALTLGQMIDDGTLDPVSLTEACLDRISHEDPGAHIFWHGSEDRALTEAIAAHDRARRNLRRSPLDGVPVAWKDNIEALGAPTTNGSRLLAHHVGKRDAAVLARAARAGTICLGKTALTEFAFSGIGYNPMLSSPGNAFDETLLPGGSSCGSAVAVARGLAPIAVGTDTAGSIRIPASWNGLVGLKPTPGSVPMDGILPLSRTRDVVGPIARNVSDAAALWAIMTARPAADLHSVPLSRAAFLMPTEFEAETESTVWKTFAHAAEQIGIVGAKVEHTSLPLIAELQAHADEHGNAVAAEGWAEWGEIISTAPEKSYDNVRIRMEKGASGFDGARLVRVTHELDAFRTRFLAATAHVDAVLLPTVASLPSAIAELSDPKRYAEVNLKALRFTRLANMLGLPALTLPCGMADETVDHPALPVGLSLLGAPGTEAKLLRLGAAIEAILPGIQLPIS